MRDLLARAAELATAARFLASVADGPAALIIEGPPGIGKTSLWERTRTAAREQGFCVLSAQPARSESAMSLAGFGDLFADAPPELVERLPGPQRATLDAALLRAGPSGAPLDQRTLAVAALALVRALAAAHGRVLIAIDDAHWLDESSAAVLAFVLRRLHDVPAGVLLCWRGESAFPGPLDAEVAMPGGRCRRAALGPLPRAAVHRLLLDRLGEDFPRAALGKIAQASGGNPFYAVEIARTLTRSGAGLPPGGPLPVPESLATLTGARIEAMPAATRRVLLVAALAAEPSLDVLRRAGVADPRGALRPAADNGIVETVADAVRFTHPLFASAAMAGADPARTREIHAALALASGSEEARARHLGMAADGPDETAASALASAAERAGQRGAPEVAAELMELAHELTPAGRGEVRARRCHEAARWHSQAGDLRRASELLEDLMSALGPGAGRARSGQLLGQITARSASFADALAIATGALADVGDDIGLRAEIELDIAFDSLSLGDFAEAARHAAASAASAAAAGDRGVLAEALACRCVVEFLFGDAHAEEQLSQALALEDTRRPAPMYARPGLVRGLLLLFTGRVDEAAAVLSGLRAAARERGQEADLAFVCMYLAWAMLWRGESAEAAKAAAEAAEVAALNPDPMTRALALTTAAMVDAYGDDVGRVREHAGQALALFQSTQWAAATIWPLWALGFAELSSGRPDRVAELLRPVAGMVTALPSADPVLGLFLPDLIEALIGLGELDEAGALTDWLARAARRAERPWAEAAACRCQATLAAARGDLVSAVAELERALAAHEQVAMPFERARTLLIKGQIHRRRKEKRLADQALRAALGAFDRAGAPVWAQRARAELGRVGLRPRASADLTETERRVAELAAGGLTNREVAEAAFISPKTVGNVLGRVYRKLGISSRAELGAWMASTGDR